MTIRPILLALAGASVLAASSVSAQTVDTLDRRLDRVEKEVRAVQRKVFPGGDDRFFEPEVQLPAGDQPDGFGVAAATPSTVLTQRIDALEAQVQSLTGQVEEQGFQLRELTAALERFEADTKFRLTTLEGGDATIAADGEGEPTPAYDAAYALYEAEDWPAAQAAFATFLEAKPEDE
ncbi:MAG: hypothetical protein WA906_10685, partial [Pacificimonas sp.]